ncbi:hypothetical protein B0T11DRAFT_273510, partial [Plectosphaerella cucumerina]
HHERRAPSNQAAQTWSQPTAMSGYNWQGQIAHPYPDTVPAIQSSQSDIPLFHHSVSFPPDPTQHYQMTSSLQSYDMSRAQGGHFPAPSPQGAVLQNHQPTFYRAAEQHIMDLTDVNDHGARTRLMSTPKPSKPHNSRNSGRSESEPKPTPEEQALRPHVVLDYFQREVKPDVDALEARQREQGEYPTDEARARLVSEALELVRPAVKNVTRALEALPPQNSQPWGGTQRRLQSDAEQILSMIQIIRRSALEEAEVRQHEPRPSPDQVAKSRKGLSSLVQDYVDKAEYVGKVTGHGARKEKTEASHRAAATNGRPQAVAYPSAGLLSIAWTRGQTTTPPPDQRSSAMEHYHHQQQQQQHHMQHGLTASPAACGAMSGFGLHDPHPPIPAASARPIHRRRGHGHHYGAIRRSGWPWGADVSSQPPSPCLSCGPCPCPAGPRVRHGCHHQRKHVCLPAGARSVLRVAAPAASSIRRGRPLAISRPPFQMAMPAGNGMAAGCSAPGVPHPPPPPPPPHYQDD